MSSVDVVIGGLILIIVILIYIFKSNNEKLKRFTIILLIGFFSWSITVRSENNLNGVILFLVVSIFVIYIWNKIDIEKREKNETIKTKEFKLYIEMLKSYSNYLEINSTICNEELRSVDSLQFDKNTLIAKTFLYIKYLEKDKQKILLYTIPQLAFYIDNIPKEGYISNSSKGITEKDDIFPYSRYYICKKNHRNLSDLLERLIIE